jgi:hypothetical protein
MGENRCNGARFAGGIGSPRGRIKIFNKDLVYAIVGGEGLDGRPAELGVNPGLTRSHGSDSPPYHTYAEVLYCTRCPTITCLYP